jgi:hypothetical protein
MKTRLIIVPVLLLAVMLLAVACHKTTETEPDISWQELWKDSSKLAFPQNINVNCTNSPNYGDTVLCDKTGNGPDYVVSPINNPGTGKYYAWPLGMKIDSITGKINVTKSESGLRYMVGFVKAGTNDTCLTELVIAGASYMDSVYVLSDGQKSANPFFNANPNNTTLCNTGNCDMDMGNGASGKKIGIDRKTGKIDLEKTLNQGAFANPVDGDIIQININYMLNDGCNTGVQHTKLYFMYFTNKSQIPPSLLSTLTLKSNNFWNGDIISRSANPRPPLIIITRYR